LTGPDELTFNPNKDVYRPGPWQILCKVEVVGLCFSDLKLLKQFDGHARKSKILSGVDASVLDEYPAYKVDSEPTVPGHEIVVRVIEQGENVTRTTVGGRYLVQADHRWLKTKASNGAIGYNIEGGLQEYMLIDERVSTSPDGEFMLIEVTDERSASAVALVEPWACVEDAYVVKERQTLTAGGNMLVCAEADVDTAAFNAFITKYGKPSLVTIVGNDISDAVDVDTRIAENIESLEDLKRNLEDHNLDIESLPLVIQYNKRDLVRSPIPTLSIEELEADLNSDLGVPSFEAAATKGTGVFETLKDISKKTIRYVATKHLLKPK